MHSTILSAFPHSVSCSKHLQWRINNQHITVHMNSGFACTPPIQYYDTFLQARPEQETRNSWLAWIGTTAPGQAQSFTPTTLKRNMALVSVCAATVALHLPKLHPCGFEWPRKFLNLLASEYKGIIEHCEFYQVSCRFIEVHILKSVGGLFVLYAPEIF